MLAKRNASEHSASESKGERDRAETLLLTHLIRFPTDQDALYRLMKLLIEAEAFQEALVPYRQCERALKEQGHEPAPPLQALAQRLLDLDLTGLAQAKARHLQQSLTTPHPLAELLVVPASFANSLSSQTLLPFSNAIKQGILDAIQELEGTLSLNAADFATRRAILAALWGVPFAESILSPVIPSDVQPQRTLLSEELLTFFEHALTSLWELYYTGGAGSVAQSIGSLIREITNLLRFVQGMEQRQRVLILLTLGYQLQCCVFRDRTDYAQAHKAYQRAVEIAQELEDAELIASALAREGVDLYSTGAP